MALIRTLLCADRAWNTLAAGLLLGAAILIGLTFADYGVTWDEDVHNWYGYFAITCRCSPISGRSTGSTSIITAPPST